MRAALCPQAGRIEIRERPVPAVTPNEVLVRVHACGVCGSDLHWFRGGYPPPQICPGHEMAGEVAAVGSAVHSVRDGDRVAVEPLVICGTCPACLRGDYQLCRQFQLIGTMRDGGFADYIVVPATAVFPLPGALEFDLGALTEPMAVCVHAARLANLRVGERVLILGAGTIGLLSVMVAHASGAAEIAITARYPQQQAMARRLGATHVFAASPEGEQELRAFADEHPIDVAIETVGGEAETINDGIHAVRSGGSVVVLGVFMSQPRLSALALMLKEVRVIGSLMYGRTGAQADFDVALSVLAAHADVLRPMITHRFELGSIQEAFETAASKDHGSIKVTIFPDRHV